MSNQSKRKHPFLSVKVDKKHTAEEIEVLKSIANEEFNLLANEWLENKSNCSDVNNSQIANCDCLMMLHDHNNLEIIAECVTEALFASKELQNYYANEVIGGGCIASKLIKKCCAKVHILSKSNQHLAFCKYAACFSLNIGRRKYQSMIKEYSEVSKKAHGNIGNIIDEKHISTHELECASCIKNIVAE